MGIITTEKNVSKNKLCYTSENQQKSHFMDPVLTQRISLSFFDKYSKVQWFFFKVKPKQIWQLKARVDQKNLLPRVKKKKKSVLIVIFFVWYFTEDLRCEMLNQDNGLMCYVFFPKFYFSPIPLYKLDYSRELHKRRSYKTSNHQWIICLQPDGITALY